MVHEKEIFWTRPKSPGQNMKIRLPNGSAMIIQIQLDQSLRILCFKCVRTGRIDRRNPQHSQLAELRRRPDFGQLTEFRAPEKLSVSP